MGGIARGSAESLAPRWNSIKLAAGAHSSFLVELEDSTDTPNGGGEEHRAEKTSGKPLVRSSSSLSLR